MSLYAFNGFVLEQLPIWDNSLSYAAIVYRENVQSREIMLISSNAELKYDPNNGLKVPAGTTIQRCPLMIIDGVMSWHTYSAETLANTAYYSTPIWANYDLKTTANAAYISASEPVPFDQITTDKTWVKVSGEKLPEFPDANAEYPYTYVVYSLEFNGYLMIRSKNPAYVDLDISTTNVFFQEGYIVSKYLPAYGKPYWDSFVTPRQVAEGMANYSDIIWHSVINNRAGLPYYEASTAPTPWPKFDLKTFCAFLAAGLCMPPIPRGKLPPKTDILDNEWPIEWSMAEVAGNSNNFATDGILVCHVSNLSPTLEEINAMTVTATVDGNSINFIKTLSEDFDGYISASFIDSASGNGMIGLVVTSVTSILDNIPAQVPGLYVYTVQTGDYEGLDIHFTLTKGGT